jgi:hypothetical protein
MVGRGRKKAMILILLIFGWFLILLGIVAARRGAAWLYRVILGIPPRR